MGMSASQVRFLSLQHRKHNVGRELMTLSNRKLGLSRDMNRVSQLYARALDQKKLMWTNDAGNSYLDLSYDLMMKPNENNCQSPYIITDKEGRVVVDDSEITYERNGEMVSTGITYRQLASLISSYSGVDDNGNVLYGNTSRLNGYNSSLGVIMTRQGNGLISTVNGSATSGAKCEIKDGYKLVNSSSDYNYDTALRYELLAKLGIISPAEHTEYVGIMEELYGSKSAADDGDYTVDYNNSIGITTENEKFGKLVSDLSGGLNIRGGSAMGNLELAKQYKKEYELYRNTPLKVQSTPISYGANTTRNTLITDYEYSFDYYQNRNNTDVPTNGITTRILDLLKNTYAGTDLVNSSGYYNYDVGIGRSHNVLETVDNAMNLYYNAIKGKGTSYNGTHNDGSGSDSWVCGIYDIGAMGAYYHLDTDDDPYTSCGAGNYAIIARGTTVTTGYKWTDFFSGDYHNTATGAPGTMDDYAIFTNMTFPDGNCSCYASDPRDVYCNTSKFYNMCQVIATDIGTKSKAAVEAMYPDKPTLFDDACEFATYMTMVKFMNNQNVFDDGSEKDQLIQSVKDAMDCQPGQSTWVEDSGSNEVTHDWRQQIQVQNWYCGDTSHTTIENTMISYTLLMDTRRLDNYVGWGDKDSYQSSLGVSAYLNDDNSNPYTFFAVNIPNLINTWITFFSSYIQSGGDISMEWKDETGARHTTGRAAGSHDVDPTDPTYGQYEFFSGGTYFSAGATTTSQCVNTRGATTDSWSGGTGTTDPDTGLQKSYYEYSYNTFSFRDDNSDGRDDSLGISSALISDIKSNKITSTSVVDTYYNLNVNDKKAFAQAYFNDLAARVAAGTTSASLMSDLRFNGYNADGTPKPALTDAECVNKLYSIFNELSKITYKYDDSDNANDLYYKETKKQQTFTAYGGGTVYATLKEFSDNHKEYQVSWQYTNPGSLPANAPIYYETRIADGGAREYTRMTCSSTGYDHLAGMYTTDLEGYSNTKDKREGVTVCQINLSNGETYWLNRYAEGSNFCSYMYVLPEDNGLGAQLDALVIHWEQKVASLESQLLRSFENVENRYMEFFDKVLKRISENGWVYDNKINSNSNSKNYLRAKLENNDYLVTECRESDKERGYLYASKLATSCTKIYTVRDSDAENVALSKYETEKNLIQAKEKKIDARMQRLETEQEVINTELDSIKKVRDENIDKTFKIFA